MNILFVFHDFVPSNGGVQRVTDILSRELIQNGHNVFFLSSGSMKMSGPTIVPVIYMDKAMDRKFDTDSVRLYKEILRKNNIQIVINLCPLDPNNNFFLKNTIDGVKTVSVYHSRPWGYLRLIEAELREYRDVTKFIKGICCYIIALLQTYKLFHKAIKYSDRFCFLTEKYAHIVLRSIPWIEKRKIISIGNPIDNISHSFNKERKKTILFVGRLDDKCKNLLGALEVWRRFQKTHSDWSLKIIGDDTKIVHIKECAVLQEISNFEFLGHISDVSPYYDEAQFIIMTSYYEGWPMVLCEAMSRGCIPCVYSTYEAAYDIIQDDAGLICTPFNAEEMANKLSSIVSLPNKLKQMSEAATSSIKRYETTKIIAIWERLFNELIHN